MPRRSSYLRVMDEYLRDLELRGTEKKTRKNYECTILKAYRTLKENDLLKHPKRLGLEEVSLILRDFRNSEAYTQQFKIFLNWIGNPVMRRMRIVFQKRMNVDWLTIQQLEILKLNCVTPLEKMIFHLLAETGLRRIELQRLLVQDIHLDKNRMLIRGKGGRGMGTRMIALHPYFPKVYQDWIDERDLMIAKARKYNLTVEIPPELLIWRRHGKLGAYKAMASFENTLRKLRKRSGLKFAHHTLRRSFARSVWELLGDDYILRLSKHLGHKDIRTTLDYIGAETDHTQPMMDKYAQKMFLTPTIHKV